MCIAEAVENDKSLHMEVCVNDIYTRLVHNKMCLNSSRNNVLIVVNSNRKRFSNTRIEIDDKEIPKTNVSKLLGVLINVKADWCNHVNCIYSKACTFYVS